MKLILKMGLVIILVYLQVCIGFIHCSAKCIFAGIWSLTVVIVILLSR